MNQLNWHGTENRRNNSASLTFIVALLSFVLVAALCGGNVIASTGETPQTSADPVAANPATVVEEPARQATVTIDGKASIHYYESAFATTLSHASQNPPGRNQAEKNQVANDQASRATLDRQIASYNPFLWIFDVALHLNTDHDHDGHYSNFSLTLDLDTSFSATTVYAVLYLANEGGPWNEYAVTGNFTISGSGPGDTFSLNAELDSGYPSGYYNHHIEIYDAYSHELIGSYGPNDSHQLFGLPIESRLHDEGINFGADLSLSFSGTGSTGLSPLALAVVCLLITRHRKAKIVLATR